MASDSRPRRRHLAREWRRLPVLAPLLLALAGCLGDGAAPPLYRVSLAVGESRAFRVTPRGEFGPSAAVRRNTIDLGAERRRARPARPGNSARAGRGDFEVEVATDGLAEGSTARLRFAYGRAALDHARARGGEVVAPLGPVEFRVEESGEGGTTTHFSGRLEPIPGDAATERWHEGAIEVGAGPTPRRFRFRTIGSAPSESTFWGDVHLEGPPAEAPRSVLLISIDTLRADRLSLLGRRPEVTTPRLDAWARRRAVAFSDAVAASPWTLPSHASIFSGLDALRHGVNHEEKIDGVRFAAAGRGAPYLAELLRDAGIRSGAATGGGMVAPQFGFAVGFDVYRWWPGPKTDARELPDAVERALAWLRSYAGQPSLFFLHTYRVHSPFPLPPATDDPAAPAALDLRFDPPLEEHAFRNDRGRLWELDAAGKATRQSGDLARLSAAYDDGVRAADAALGELLETIEREGLDRGLTVVVTSDHGEALGEHGRFGHHDLDEPTISVPLLLAVPGGAPRLVSRQVRHVDILPTLLEAFGVAAPDGLDGVSLLPFARGGEVAVPRDAWVYSGYWNQGLALRRDGRLKLRVDDTAWARPRRDRVSAYDLGSDPLERTPLSAAALAALPDDPRGLALRRLRAASGLWLRLSNGGGAPLRLQLRGAAILHEGIKHSLVPGIEVDWVETGLAEVTVAPGAAGSLRLPHVSLSGVEIQSAAAGGPRTLFFSADHLADEPRLVLDQNQWLPLSRPLAAGEIGLEFFWQGAVRRTPEPPDPVEGDNTEEQLRALGYLG